MKRSWTRRRFINSVGLATASLAAGPVAYKTLGSVETNKRDALLSLLDSNKKQDYTPAAFFLHFDDLYHQGQGAIDKHLEFFRHTGMDFVKIQYERTFPHKPEIKTADDWAKMPLYNEDFYEPQLKVVEGLVKAAKKDALVLATLYSPFMCAGHTTSTQDSPTPNRPAHIAHACLRRTCLRSWHI